MELIAPRLVKEFGFHEPVFSMISYEAHATLAHEKCVLEIVGEGPSMWVFMDFEDGPRKRVNLTRRVETSLERPFTPIEDGSAKVRFSEKVLAWDGLLADYLTHVGWSPEHFPEEWLVGL